MTEESRGTFALLGEPEPFLLLLCLRCGAEIRVELSGSSSCPWMRSRQELQLSSGEALSRTGTGNQIGKDMCENSSSSPLGGAEHRDRAYSQATILASLLFYFQKY